MHPIWPGICGFTDPAQYMRHERPEWAATTIFSAGSLAGYRLGRRCAAEGALHLHHHWNDNLHHQLADRQ
jgi:hypothetical protein